MTTMCKVDPATFDKQLESGALYGNPYLPILLAVRRGACALLSVFHGDIGTPLPTFDVPKEYGTLGGKGIVVQIGDDLDESKGVAAFDAASLDTMLGRCSGVVLQVADFRKDIMLSAAALASLGGVIAIIETRERHEIEWLEKIKAKSKCPVVFITTREAQS